jgi:hypothetical protein
VYVGTTDVDPRTQAGATGMSEPVGVTDEDTWKDYNGQFKLPGWALRTVEFQDGETLKSKTQFQLPPFAFFVTGSTTGSDTTVFVVNELDENKVTPTGIFIDNLPYILMVGIPIAVFAVLFANRLRKNAAA